MLGVCIGPTVANRVSLDHSASVVKSDEIDKHSVKGAEGYIFVPVGLESYLSLDERDLPALALLN